MSRIEKINKEYQHASESNDVVFLLRKIEGLKDILVRIEQESAASWIAEIASNGLKELYK